MTPDTARDVIFALLADSWTSAALTPICGYVPEMRWQGVEEPTTMPVDQIWGRASLQFVNEYQATLRNGDDDTRRFRHEGLVFVQVFAPRGLGDSFIVGRNVADHAKKCFRGKSTEGIWLRNAKATELEPDTAHYRWNVVVEFEFDEVTN